MKSIIISVLCIFTITLSAQIAKKQPAQQAESLLKANIQNGKLAGMVAGILKRDQIVWMSGAGYRDLENQVPADTHTLHRIASIAKPMTAVAIMQLVEANQIDLDASIQQYLPGFPKKQEGEITVRQLMSHSSGIPTYKGKAEAFPKRHYPSLTNALQVFQDRKLQFSPGQDYGYATYNYVVLGAILEAVTGQSYESYMKEHIWEPAGMKQTGVEWAGKTFAHKAKLYKRKKSGELLPATPTDLSLKIPGGGLQSTIGDLLRFGQAICTDQLISQSSLDILIKNTGLKKEGNPYGMGWYLYGTEDDPSGRIIGHSGSQTGTGAQLAIFLDAGVVVAGFSNTTDSWNEVVQMVFQLAGLANGF